VSFTSADQFQVDPSVVRVGQVLAVGEMLAPLTAFSDEFEVSLRSMMSKRREGGLRTAQATNVIAINETPTMAIVRVQKDDWLRCSVGTVALTPAAEDPLAGAMKRYPRRARVSMNTGASADSPSASRSLLIAAFRL